MHERTAGSIGIRTAQGNAPTNVKRPDRRSPTYEKNGGQKSTIPGVRMMFPGNGNRLEQFSGDQKEESHKPACEDHHDLEKLREPGRRFSCDTKAPEFPCHPRAEVLEHAFPYPWRRAGSYLNYFDGPG